MEFEAWLDKIGQYMTGSERQQKGRTWSAALENKICNINIDKKSIAKKILIAVSDWTRAIDKNPTDAVKQETNRAAIDSITETIDFLLSVKIENQWQPIKTALKDETMVSLWTRETDAPKEGELYDDWLRYRNRWIPIAVFDEDMGWSEYIGGTWYQIKERITHWQPRPQPPQG